MLQCIECTYNTKIKCNLERHIINKHKKAAQKLNNLSQKLNNLSQNLNNLSQNLNNLSQNLNIDDNNILPNQCLQCNKIYSSKKGLKVHLLNCKGINKDKQCIYCKKMLATKQSKDRHQLICKDKDTPTTIINNTTINDNSITNIDNSTTNNIQNNDNSVNIVVFNSNPKQTTKFDTHHITPEVLIQIFKQSMNNNTKLCSNLLDIIWEQVNNRCIIKPNIKTQISKISGENGSWLSGLDLDIYPKYLKDAYKTSKRLITKYKPELYKTLNEKKVDETYNNMDTYQSLEMDDKPLTDAYMIEDNFSRGYSKDECAEMRKEQKLDNILIEEYQRNYKRYRCKASDNAKRFA